MPRTLTALTAVREVGVLANGVKVLLISTFFPDLGVAAGGDNVTTFFTDFVTFSIVTAFLEGDLVAVLLGVFFAEDLCLAGVFSTGEDALAGVFFPGDFTFFTLGVSPLAIFASIVRRRRVSAAVGVEKMASNSESFVISFFLGDFSFLTGDFERERDLAFFSEDTFPSAGKLFFGSVVLAFLADF